jgi:ERF superfamily
MTDEQAETTTKARRGSATPKEPVDPKVAACAALVAALGELTNPGRESTATVQTKSGGTYSYAYASLDVVLDEVRPVLARHGLALTQSVEAKADGLVIVGTRILHEAGEVALMAPTIARVVEGGPQEVGSFVTYARRYQVLAVLGIHPAGEDDDAAAAQPATRSGSARQPREDGGLPDPVIGGLHLSERTTDALQKLVDQPPSVRVGAMAKSWLDRRIAEAEASGVAPEQAVLPDADHDDDAGSGYGS